MSIYGLLLYFLLKIILNGTQKKEHQICIFQVPLNLKTFIVYKFLNRTEEIILDINIIIFYSIFLKGYGLDIVKEAEELGTIGPALKTGKRSYRKKQAHIKKLGDQLTYQSEQNVLAEIDIYTFLGMVCQCYFG